MNTKRIVYMSVLTAIGVAMCRFFSVQLPILKINFGFIPTMIGGMCFGPFMSGAVDALIDFIGANLFPTGVYFVGFTLSAFLGGAIYGVCFHKREITYKNVVLALSLKKILVDTLLNTFWLTMIIGKAYMALLPVRLIKNIISIPIETAVFMAVLCYMKNASITKKIKEID